MNEPVGEEQQAWLGSPERAKRREAPERWCPPLEVEAPACGAGNSLSQNDRLESTSDFEGRSGDAAGTNVTAVREAAADVVFPKQENRR